MTPTPSAAPWRSIPGHGFVLAVLVSLTTCQPAAAQVVPKARAIVEQAINAANLNAVALEYKVLAIKNGEENPVDPATHIFNIGDQCRIEVTPKNDLFLYVVTQSPVGQRAVLYPSGKDMPAAAKADTSIRLPGPGRAFGFQAPVGDEKLAVIATKVPLENPEPLLKLAFEDNARPGRVHSDDATSKATPDDLEKFKKELEEAEHRPLDISDEPDEENDSFFEGAIHPDNPRIIINIPLRSREAPAGG